MVEFIQRIAGRAQVVGKSGRRYGWQKSHARFKIHRADLDPARFKEVT